MWDRSREFLTSYLLLLLLQAASYFFLAADRYNALGLAVASLFAVGAFRRKEQERPFAIQRGRIVGSIVLVLICLAAVFGTVGYSFHIGSISFTYSDHGLDPKFISRIGFYAALFCVGIVYGTELYFRALIFSTLEANIFSKNALQALLFTLWLTPAVLHPLELAEGKLICLFLLGQLLSAAIAGLLFALSGSIVVSGIWSSLTGFFWFFVVSDIEFGFASAFYLVASASTFYLVLSSVQVLLILILSFVLLRIGAASPACCWNR